MTDGVIYTGKVVINSAGAFFVIPASIIDGEFLNDVKYGDEPRGVDFSNVKGCQVVISVNGMANADGTEFADRIRMFLSENARPFHNPSNFAIPFFEGPRFGDVLQSLIYETGLQDSASVDLADLTDEAYDKLRAKECAKPCIKIYAHSQGTMLVRRAFDWLKYAVFTDESSLGSVCYFGYGGETSIDGEEYGLRWSYNALNSGDLIKLLPTHWGDEITGEGGHPFLYYIK